VNLGGTGSVHLTILEASGSEPIVYAFLAKNLKKKTKQKKTFFDLPCRCLISRAWEVDFPTI